MRVTTEPRSDQWNAEDFIGGSRTFTIASVRVGGAEQKYDIELIEGEGRVWRPPLTVLRLLVAGWGDYAEAWTGRRVTLYRDPSIRFGKDAVGGIRISHMSDLPDGKPLEINLAESRGKRAKHRVEPLTEPTPLTDAMIACATDRDQLKAWWKQRVDQRPAIEARVAELDAEIAGGE